MGFAGGLCCEWKIFIHLRNTEKRFMNDYSREANHPVVFYNNETQQRGQFCQQLEFHPIIFNTTAVQSAKIGNTSTHALEACRNFWSSSQPFIHNNFPQ